MTRHFSDLKFSILVLVLVSILSVLTLIESDPKANSDSNNNNTMKPLLEVSGIDQDYSIKQRRPATANSETFSSQVIKAEFLCDQTEKGTQVQHKQGMLMMMSFKVCAKNTMSVSLMNESNGFKAQVFKIDSENYKTDFIQLSKGSNQIRVEIILKDGQKLEDSLVILTGS